MKIDDPYRHCLYQLNGYAYLKHTDAGVSEEVINKAIANWAEHLGFQMQKLGLSGSIPLLKMPEA